MRWPPLGLCRGLCGLCRRLRGLGRRLRCRGLSNWLRAGLGLSWCLRRGLRGRSLRHRRLRRRLRRGGSCRLGSRLRLRGCPRRRLARGEIFGFLARLRFFGFALNLFLGLALGALLRFAARLLFGFLARTLLLGAEHRVALRDDVADGLRDERTGAHRVVVAGNHVIDAVGIAVGVDEADDGNAQALRLAHRDRLGLQIDHEHRVGHALHVLDAAQVGPQLGEIGLRGHPLARGQQRQLTLGLIAFEIV
jgi:hypothetical protein